MGRRGIRGLETRVGRECSINKGLNCTEKPEEEVTVLGMGTQLGVAAPRVRAVKSSEFGEGKL